MRFRDLHLLLVSSLLLAPTIVQAGWQQTEWGMTQQQVQSLYPTATEIVPPIPFGVGSTPATLEIKRYEIAGHIFHVRFLMDTAQRLTAVRLDKIDSDPSTRAFDTAQELLTQKYGRPQPGMTCHEGDRQLEWKAADSGITLSYGVSPSRRYLTSVEYVRLSSSELEKL